MAKKNESLLRMLFEAPWWVSVLISGFSYLFLNYIFPRLLVSDAMVSQAFLNAARDLSPMVALVFLFPAPFAFLRSYISKKRLENTSSVSDIAKLDWMEFEALLGEFYRQQGYTVKQKLSHSSDGGVDIKLTKDRKVSLVQCKHWKKQKVGVKVLRELYGVLLDSKADKMIVITSGEFTIDAQQFAQHKEFDLINGVQLVSMLAQTQQSNDTVNIDISTQEYGTQLGNGKPIETTSLSTCPKCGSELTLRTARKGSNAGTQFYGCIGFPKCRYTRSK